MAQKGTEEGRPVDLDQFLQGYISKYSPLSRKAKAITKSESSAEDAVVGAAGEFALKFKDIVKINGRLHIKAGSIGAARGSLYRAALNRAIDIWRNREFGPRAYSGSELKKLESKLEDAMTAANEAAGLPPPTKTEVKQALAEKMEAEGGGRAMRRVPIDPVEGEGPTWGFDEEHPSLTQSESGFDIANDERGSVWRGTPAQRASAKRAVERSNTIRTLSLDAFETPGLLTEIEKDVINLNYQGMPLEKIGKLINEGEKYATALRDDGLRKIRRHINERLAKKGQPPINESMESTPFGFISKRWGLGSTLLAMAALGGLLWFVTRKKES